LEQYIEYSRRLNQAYEIKQFLSNEKQFNDYSNKGFKHFDKNGDGKLDLEEAKAAIYYVSDYLRIDRPSSDQVQHFYKTMQNKKGEIGITEFRAALRFVLGQFLQRF